MVSRNSESPSSQGRCSPPPQYLAGECGTSSGAGDEELRHSLSSPASEREPQSSTVLPLGPSSGDLGLDDSEDRRCSQSIAKH